MSYETILYEKKGRILYITLNRPERLNAFNMKMISELSDAWERFKRDGEVWVAIVTGSGRAMCVGVDVRELSSGDGLIMARTAREEVIPVQDWSPRVHKICKPVIAAINGFCCGGGLDFATECDIVVASEKAEFWDPHVTVGLISNHEMVQMSRRIPLGLCLRMAILGGADRMNAERAYQVGLISEVVPHERLMARATEIAEAVLQQAPLAVRGTKQCILEGCDKTLDEAIEHGEYIRRENIGSEDITEGPKAFVEKRKPLWKVC